MGLPQAESPLSRAFYDAWAGPHSLGAAELDGRLEKAIKAGRAAWPDAENSPAAFVAFVARRIPPNAELGAALDRFCLADAWLVCACEAGHRGAIDRLSTLIAGVASDVASRFRNPVDADELSQRARERLLVAAQGGSARISTWSGAAPVEAWLRAVIARVAADLGERRGREVSLEDSALDVLDGAEPNADHALLRARFQPQFKSAFRAALESLEPRDRNLMRLHLIDRVSLDELARVHSVHRATIARWLARAREKVLEETQRSLAAAIGVSPGEVQSLVGMLKSQLDVTLGPLRDSSEDG